MNSTMELPSQFQIGSRVQFAQTYATVVGVHFTESKVRYDLDMNEIPDEDVVSVFGIDSCFVHST